MKELLAKPKAWLVISILGVLVILLLGWFLLISTQLSNVSTLQEETETAQMQTQTLRAREAALTKQLADLPALEAELARLYEQLPNDADVADLVRQIDAANQTAGVRVVDFTVDPPTALTLPEAVASPQAETEAEGSGGAADGAAPAAQPPAAEPELSYSTVSISLDPAPFAAAIAYLNTLENLDRAFLITSADITAEEGGNVILQLTGRIYVRPPTPEEEQQAENDASPQPSPTATPSPGTSQAQ